MLIIGDIHGCFRELEALLAVAGVGDDEIPRADAAILDAHAQGQRNGCRRGVGVLLDRLAVRYGPAATLRFAAANSHIPERAAYLAQVQGKACDMPWLDNEPGEPPLRPLFLFDPPQLIDVLAAIPDGPPRRFRWRSKQYVVRFYEGPERIAPEWWRRRDGCANPGYSRDYYRVEDGDGHRFWLFRHGLYGRETSQPRWYVHGLFA